MSRLGYVINNDGDVVGFVLKRGRQGHEAFGREERSLGLFETAANAARAVFDAAADEEGAG
jgi:hypothetical protein